ncbi:WD40-repeat-containing domain protein [Mucor mucedo]|uniref:WD40-repeat-containing domain protein n=1 Tax=Mucor mucedo TaxID=29922 RepID=UPI00221E5222|nr:WD40-repeat-containing domain protein [Mucor mucedo]KAI7873407.1 WD40-repeat-containing domain protein [Mucor mucedo]
MHTDWVNDIVLCEGGTCVVSASSDRTIKLWKPYSDAPKVAHTIGYHTDFAKCLTYASKPGWVASGGLDRKINIWDIEKSEAALSIDAGPINHYSDGTSESNSSLHNTSSKCSIYALAVNPSGTLLASGSPEKVVRLWDPRSGKRISKLTGHTDNIRALLISDDGQYILSGSSDSTIKLWSVKAQRCLTTYETHPDSVWSLYSDHPELKTFYSGSRDGLVNKTEISGQTLSEGESECIGLFKEDSGVIKIAALEDTYVWTATTSSSINRWLSVPPAESRQVLPRSEFNPDIPPSALIKLPPAKSPYTSQVTDSFVGSDSITMYAGSVLSIPISYQDEDVDLQETLIPLRASPDHVIEGKPGITAHLILHNRRHILTKDTNGEITMWDLTKCIQIKNFGKRDMEDVAQEVNSLESFPAWCSIDTKIGAITVQLHEVNCFDCEMYADEVEIPADYQVREDQRLNLGKWVLVNLFQKFIQRELEHEEEGLIRFTDDQPDRPDSIKSKSLQPTQQEEKVEAPPAVPVPPTVTIPSLNPVATDDGPKLPLTAVTTNVDQSPYLPSSPQAAQFNGPFTAPITTTTQADYFSGAHYPPVRRESSVQLPQAVALPTSPTSPTGSNFMHRLKNLSVKAKLSRIPTSEDRPGEPFPSLSTSTSIQSSADEQQQQQQQSLAAASVAAAAVAEKAAAEKAAAEKAAAEAKAAEESKLKEIEESKSECYSPPHSEDFPPLQIPSSTMIIVAEESAEASTGMDLYRGTVGSSGEDADTIIEAAPAWLLAFLLYNKTPPKETVKLTFVLKPASGSKLEELPGG